MTFVFWQNMMSIHQSAFLNALSNYHQVILVVENLSDEIRDKSGWEIPTINCHRLIITPSEDTIKKIISQYSNGVHIISGIDITFKKYHLIGKLINQRCKLLSYLEPLNPYGFKGFLRHIKYTYLRRKYGNHICGMLTTGKMGLQQYTKLGFKNVFEWGYFTESMSLKLSPEIECTQFPRFLFVGSLDKRKNIIELIKLFIQPDFQQYHLGIIGTGPYVNEVRNHTQVSKNLQYLGTVPNYEVKRIMHTYDVLILPSLFDGWGAVINEALLAGMRVICSDRCGASTLLKDKSRGDIFSLSSRGDMKKKIFEQVKQGKQTTEQRHNIEEWSHSHLSGEIATKYFLSICDTIFQTSQPKPIAPWDK